MKIPYSLTVRWIVKCDPQQN